MSYDGSNTSLKLAVVNNKIVMLYVFFCSLLSTWKYLVIFSVLIRIGVIVDYT